MQEKPLAIVALWNGKMITTHKSLTHKKNIWAPKLKTKKMKVKSKEELNEQRLESFTCGKKHELHNQKQKNES